MTVAAATPINSFVGNGSASSFAFTFPVFLSSQIIVTAVLASTGGTSTLVLGTDYSVTGLNASGDPASTGSIALLNLSQAWLSGGNLATGYTLVIQSSFSYSQTTSIRNQGDFYRAALENALDTLEYQIQQLILTIGAQLILPTGLLPSAFSPILPQGMPSSPGLALVVNAAGNGLALGAGGSVTVPVSVAQGGTNSTAALANGKLMASSGGKIVEVAADSSMASNKITNLKDGTAAKDAAAFDQIYYGFQAPVKKTSVTTFSTTNAAYQTTNLSQAFALTDSTHRVKITISACITTAGAGLPQISLFAGGTDLDPGTNGFAVCSTTMTAPVSVVFIYSPASTSSITYSVKLLSSNGATSVSFGSVAQVMILEEIV